MLGITLPWTSMPFRGELKYSQLFHLQKLAWWATWIVYKLCFLYHRDTSLSQVAPTGQVEWYTYTVQVFLMIWICKFISQIAIKMKISGILSLIFFLRSPKGKNVIKVHFFIYKQYSVKHPSFLSNLWMNIKDVCSNRQMMTSVWNFSRANSFRRQIYSHGQWTCKHIGTKGVTY